MWDFVFNTANLLAILCWIVLIALPRTPLALSAIMYLGVAILCSIYTLGLGALLAGLVDPGLPTGSKAGGMDFGSIDGVRAIFASDAGVTIGWVHYLAFDLFVGVWIAKDADQKRFSRVLQIPILLATFLAGPVGLLIWLIVRERSARRAARGIARSDVPV